MTIKAVRSMTVRGINVKGYFILGFPTETEKDMTATVDLVHQLWDCTATDPGRFRCSVFEFRPYPGTTEWRRILATGRYSPEQLLNYEHVNLPDRGRKPILLDRDEFNFSVNIQFGEVPVQRIREEVARLMAMQKEKLN
jgi:anaerobic magnesium-protoporphyrin IX monomethyl ester cyclase